MEKKKYLNPILNVFSLNASCIMATSLTPEQCDFNGSDQDWNLGGGNL